MGAHYLPGQPFARPPYRYPSHGYALSPNQPPDRGGEEHLGPEYLPAYRTT